MCVHVCVCVHEFQETIRFVWYLRTALRVCVFRNRRERLSQEQVAEFCSILGCITDVTVQKRRERDGGWRKYTGREYVYLFWSKINVCRH